MSEMESEIRFGIGEGRSLDAADLASTVPLPQPQRIPDPFIQIKVENGQEEEEKEAKPATAPAEAAERASLRRMSE